MANQLQQAINKQTNIYTTYTTRSGSKFSQQSLVNDLQQAIYILPILYILLKIWVKALSARSKS